MRLFHRPTAPWACFAILSRGLRAAPDLAFPVNSQVPPVAYASEPYYFAFSDSTFRSDQSSVSYALAEAPSWLSLDSNRRSLQGRPASNDVGVSTFQVRASDRTGETSSEVTLVILERPNVGLGKPILSDLEAAGPISAPSVLLLQPFSPFTITFAADVFSGISPSTNYYGISANSSPLPPWVQFDSTQVRFFGITPPLVSSRDQQQFYGISLIASDVPGFAEATVTFQIAIAHRILAFAQPTSTLIVTPGTGFESPPFRGNLTLDDRQVERHQISSVSADLPSWMHLDTEKIILSGIIPEDFRTANVLISAKDEYGNRANVAVEFKTNGNDGAAPQETVRTTAVIGEDFTYTFPTSIIGDVDRVSTDLSGAPSWMAFSAGSFMLHGKVPSDLQPQDVDVVFITTTNGNATSVQLTVHLMRKQTVSSTGVSTITSMSSKTADPDPAPTEMTRGNIAADEGGVRPKHIVFIVLIAVLPVLLVTCCIFLLIWWLRRRSKRSASNEDESEEGHHQGPPPRQNAEILDTVDFPPVAESSLKTSNRRVTPHQAPQVDLTWAPDSLQKTKERVSKKLQKRKLGSFDSSWSGLVVRPETRISAAQSTNIPIGWQRDEADAIPPVTIAATRSQSTATKASRSRKRDTTQERRSKGLSSISTRRVGVHQRRSGAGHGSGILAVDPDNAAQSSSWQTTLGSIPRVESRPSTMVLESFPAPPSENKENQVANCVLNIMKPSLRIVDPSSELTDSFEAQRQRWHTERARDKLEGVARFSNAGSSRSFPTPRAMGSFAFSPDRAISSTIPENETCASRTRDLSWSKLAGVGPGSRAESPSSARAMLPLFTPTRPRIAREVSVASSGQFDSALSSESQWEDENLVPEVNDVGEVKWHTDTESAVPSPRLPFEPFSSSQEEVSSARQVGMSRGARLIDRRKHVSLGDAEFHRSEKSQAGSFRFI